MRLERSVQLVYPLRYACDLLRFAFRRFLAQKPIARVWEYYIMVEDIPKAKDTRQLGI